MKAPLTNTMDVLNTKIERERRRELFNLEMYFAENKISIEQQERYHYNSIFESSKNKRINDTVNIIQKIITLERIVNENNKLTN